VRLNEREIFFQLHILVAILMLVILPIVVISHRVLGLFLFGE